MAALPGGAAQVDTQSACIARLANEWPMLEALMGGTAAMRANGEKLLPKWPNEELKSWENRRDTATLFPAFRRTVSVMAGKPFAKQAVLSDDTPPEIVAWAEDIDREGVNLHTFASEMLLEALAHGLGGILVEAPKPIENGAPVPTIADQKEAGVRPYWVRVTHSQIVGFRAEAINGARQLTQLRIKETAAVPDGEYGEREAERIRVLTPGAWAVFEKQDAQVAGANQWLLIESGLSGLPYIPFVPLYGFRQGYMDGISPLRDLAYLNVKHWQSQSDQDTILHVARVPILAVSGGDDQTSIVVGAASAVKLPAGAELKFVEHTGAAIEAGSKSLDDLEDQMIQAGAELLVKQSGQRTATESANDAEGNKSDLQRIVEGFEDSLDAALQMTADYASLPKGGNVSLYKDFGATTLSAATAILVTAWQAAGLITKVTAIQELQRRGELSPDIDPDEEVQNAADEAPAPMAAPPALKEPALDNAA